MPHRTDPSPRLGPFYTGNGSIQQLTRENPQTISLNDNRMQRETSPQGNRSDHPPPQHHPRRQFRTDSLTALDDQDESISHVRSSTESVSQRRFVTTGVSAPILAPPAVTSTVPLPQSQDLTDTGHQRPLRQHRSLSEQRHESDDDSRSAMWMSLLSLESDVTEGIPSNSSSRLHDRSQPPRGGTIWIGDMPLDFERATSLPLMSDSTCPSGGCPQQVTSLDTNSNNLATPHGSVQTTGRRSRQRPDIRSQETGRPLHITIEVITDEDSDTRMSTPYSLPPPPPPPPTLAVASSSTSVPSLPGQPVAIEVRGNNTFLSTFSPSSPSMVAVTAESTANTNTNWLWAASQRRLATRLSRAQPSPSEIMVAMAHRVQQQQQQPNVAAANNSSVEEPQSSGHGNINDLDTGIMDHTRSTAAGQSTVRQSSHTTASMDANIDLEGPHIRAVGSSGTSPTSQTSDANLASPQATTPALRTPATRGFSQASRSSTRFISSPVVTTSIASSVHSNPQTTPAETDGVLSPSRSTPETVATRAPETRNTTFTTSAPSALSSASTPSRPTAPASPSSTGTRPNRLSTTERTREERASLYNSIRNFYANHQRSFIPSHPPLPPPLLPGSAWFRGPPLRARPSYTGSATIAAATSTTGPSSSGPGPRYPPPRMPFPSASASSSSSSYASRLYRTVPPGSSYTATAAAAASVQNTGSHGGGDPSWAGGYRTGLSHGNHGSHGGSNGGAGSGKTVFRMDCRYCSAVVCLRGMKAMLLADISVELYSTDHPPGSVQLIDKDYTTMNCKCRIRDVACRVCGNVVGYHITQPCRQCLDAPNNGHFWMFHTEGVVGQDRLRMDLGQLVQALLEIYTEEAEAREAAEATLSEDSSGTGVSSSSSTSSITRSGTPATSMNTSGSVQNEARRRHLAVDRGPQELHFLPSAYSGDWQAYAPALGSISPTTNLVWNDDGSAGFTIGERNIQPSIWNAWLPSMLPSSQSIISRARAAAAAAAAISAARSERESQIAERRRLLQQRRRHHSSAEDSEMSRASATTERGGDGQEADGTTVSSSANQHRGRRRRHRRQSSGCRPSERDVPPHVLLNTILNTNNVNGAPLYGRSLPIFKAGGLDVQTIRSFSNSVEPNGDGNYRSNSPSFCVHDLEGDMMGMNEMAGNKVLESIMNLNLLYFLQPLKWEQLPHPDFDIDLDPATMGGDPLFATQWVEMVTQAAQTAALNMWMALNEEFEEYCRVQDDAQLSAAAAAAVGSETSSLSTSSALASVVNSNNRRVSEGESSTAPALNRTFTTASTSSSNAGAAHGPQSTSGRQGPIEEDDTTMNARDGEMGQFAPEGHGAYYDNEIMEGCDFWNDGDDSDDLFFDDEDNVDDPMCVSEEQGWLDYQRYFYHDAATLETIAKAAATAAAADAAATANSLVFGRRVRRDYEMICR